MSAAIERTCSKPVIIRKVGDKLRGMVCGTCDNPYTMAALDDFVIDGDPNALPTTGATAVADPYSSLPVPTAGTCTTARNNYGTATSRASFLAPRTFRFTFLFRF